MASPDRNLTPWYGWKIAHMVLSNTHSLALAIQMKTIWFYPKILDDLTFQSLDFERTSWRLFQKRVVYTIFDFPIFRFWAYLMKVIPETCRVYYIWLSNLSTLSVLDEGYSRNVSCILYLTFQSFDLERTWWRLFQKRVVCTIFDFPIFRPWAYLMKVIPETCRVYYIWLSNLSTLSVPDEGYYRNVSCELYLISTFLFVLYIFREDFYI